jgi:hypothetical protein
MAEKLATSIAGGAWTQVRINGTVLGLAQGSSYNEDFAVQGLETLGHLGPREYNSFGYNCEVTVRWLVSKDKKEFDQFVPKRSDVQKDGLMPDNVLEFVDIATGAVHSSFSGAVLNRVSENIEANQFVAGDLSFLCVERTK